jgi:hypothetical protein
MKQGRYTLVMMPESYYQLVKVLHQEHEDLWAKVSWYLANNEQQFVYTMNAELNVFCLLEEGIDACCQRYLKALKYRVGTKAIPSAEVLQYAAQGGERRPIFGTPEEDAMREELHNWKVKKGILPS